MSHIEEGKTSLVFANLLPLINQHEEIHSHLCIKLLRQALLMVAKEYAGDIRPYYYTFSWQELPANTGLALHIPIHPDRTSGEALPRGMGLVLDTQNGALTFRADLWAVDTRFAQRIQQRIIQRYTALAHIAALQQMNYNVSTEFEQESIHITGGRYATA